MNLEELLSFYGVKLIIGKLPNNTTFKAAPFCGHLGIDIENRLIYSSKSNYSVVDIVHELSHILFGIEDEYNWLGWEYLTCKKLNINDAIWRNQEYYIEWEGTKGIRCLSSLNDEEFIRFKEIIIETAKNFNYM